MQGPKESLICILKDQIEAIAFCPFILRNESEDSKMQILRAESTKAPNLKGGLHGVKVGLPV